MTSEISRTDLPRGAGARLARPRARGAVPGGTRFLPDRRKHPRGAGRLPRRAHRAGRRRGLRPRHSSGTSRACATCGPDARQAGPAQRDRSDCRPASTSTARVAAPARRERGVDALARADQRRGDRPVAQDRAPSPACTTRRRSGTKQNAGFGPAAGRIEPARTSRGRQGRDRAAGTTRDAARSGRSRQR